MILVLIISIIFICILILFIYSPGKLEPLKNTQGKVIQNSIFEKTWVEM